MNENERKVCSFLRNYNENIFSRVDSNSLKSIISTTIEIVLIASAGERWIPWFFMIPPILYSFIISIKNSVVISMSYGVVRNVISNSPHDTLQALPVTQFTSSIIANKASWKINIASIFHMISIVAIAYYAGIVYGLILSALFFHSIIYLDRACKEIVDIYTPVLKYANQK